MTSSASHLIARQYPAPRNNRLICVYLCNIMNIYYIFCIIYIWNVDIMHISRGVNCMDKEYRVGVVGATGYVGIEMIRILAGHRHFKLTRLVSQSYAGKKFADVEPAFAHVVDLPLSILDPDDLARECDLVVTALPHGVSASVVPQLLSLGLKVLDHSGDFRYRDAGTYEKAYKLKHPRPDLLPGAVYGLPEFYRSRIAGASLVANPGCYPTCSLLGLKPLLQARAIRTAGIVIDAVSGVSGAGRKAELAFAFCELDASFKAYSVAGHRHTSEIEQQAGFLAGAAGPLAITFTPHLAPVRRGMLATIYADLLPAIEPANLQAIYEDSYKDEVFVRVLPAGKIPETRHVAYSNFADISVHYDEHTGKVIILSAIDNLGKGAAAQAVQSLNLMAGLPETEGLLSPGSAI
jgi:N-acetyl-gamma-glutamyl-phosphate reductase